MFKKTVLVFLLLNLSLLCLGNETLKIATGEYPPYTSKNDPVNNAVNIVVAEAFSKSGISVQFEYFPWARVYIEAKGSDFDATSYWFISEKRKKDFYYSDTIVNTPTYFYHLKSNPISWKVIPDLTGKRAAVTRGYTYSDEFVKAGDSGNIDFYWNNSDKQGFKMLLAGRVDLFPMEFYPGQYLLVREFSKKQQQKITYSKQELSSSTGHLLFPKHKTSSTALLEKFNSGLRQLKKEGRFDEIFRTITEPTQ